MLIVINLFLFIGVMNRCEFVMEDIYDKYGDCLVVGGIGI